MPGLVGYLLLFIALSCFFIFFHLMLGRFLRPVRPNDEKLTIYECGEPTIGSAWVQFDLRYYVIALLFVIFDVEVAFFFPWAVVFGKVNMLANPETSIERRADAVLSLTPRYPEHDAARTELNDKMSAAAEEKDAEKKQKLLAEAEQRIQPITDSARGLAWFAFLDILVFFGVLLVGFVYLWSRGDLNWVRSTIAERVPLTTVEAAENQRVLVAADKW